MCYSLCKDCWNFGERRYIPNIRNKVFCKEGVKLIEDVSTDYYFVKSIVDKFTKLKLDPVHIYEAIQDAFAEF